MSIKAAKDVRLGGSGAIRPDSDVVVGKDCSRNRCIVFNFGAQILFFQPP
jgi:hypothetical protein